MRGLWGKVRQFIPRSRFFFFFFKEISLRAPLALSQAEDQSTVAQRSETTVDERSHDELRVNSFSP